MLGVVDYGPDLQFPIDLWPPIFLQFYLLERKGKPMSPPLRAELRLPHTYREWKVAGLLAADADGRTG